MASSGTQVLLPQAMDMCMAGQCQVGIPVGLTSHCGPGHKPKKAKKGVMRNVLEGAVAGVLEGALKGHKW
ncbi:hypothetical protein HaLaN_03589, partial [Haematococcus lacustris]